MFWFLGLEACRILAPPTGIEPTRPALEGEVLSTGLSGMSLVMFYKEKSWALEYKGGVIQSQGESP